jgi:hypothetical protein
MYNYMIRVKLLLSALALIVVSTDLYAQRRPKAEENEDTYKTFTSAGLTTNTNSGILGGFVFRQSSALSAKLFGKNQYRYLAVELVNVKHPKEVAVQQQGFITGSRFIYGKNNYLFALRPEYGREITLFNRHEEEGISVSAILAAGPSLGLEKPYVQQIKNSDGSVENRVIGFFQGFGKTKIIPGAHIKAAVSFELSAFRESVTGVEIGFLGEAFTRRPEIMLSAENRSVFTSGYVTLYFGSKKK